MPPNRSLRTTLNEVLKRYAAEGKRTFEFHSLTDDVGVDPTKVEQVLLEYLLAGKLSAQVQPRCPECGKDLGKYNRTVEIPEEIRCEICDAVFPKVPEYLDIICSIQDLDFFRVKKSTPILPRSKLVTHKAGLKRLLDLCLKESNLVKKGDLFERFFEGIVLRDAEFRIAGKHVRTKVGEIDYILGHELQTNFWKMSPYVCVECKNWIGTIPVGEVDHFVKLVEKVGPLSSIGIYLTTSKLSPEAKTTIRDARLSSSLILIAIEQDNLEGIIKTKFSDFAKVVFESTGFK